MESDALSRFQETVYSPSPVILVAFTSASQFVLAPTTPTKVAVPIASASAAVAINDITGVTSALVNTVVAAITPAVRDERNFFIFMFIILPFLIFCGIAPPWLCAEKLFCPLVSVPPPCQSSAAPFPLTQINFLITSLAKTPIECALC